MHAPNILRFCIVHVRLYYLIIAHCRYYNVMNNFNRLLLLLSNEVMIKSRDVVGPKVLSDPEMVCVLMSMPVYFHVNFVFMCAYCICLHVSIISSIEK